MSPLVWPLCFTYANPVIGRGFVSQVELSGRLIAAPEVDGTWLYGVNPGAVAASGRNLSEAYAALRDTLTKTFFDFAQSAESFEDFKRMLEVFFHETDADLAEWEAAVAQIRAGHAPVPEGLRRCPDPVVGIKVLLRKCEQLTAADNPGAARDDTPTLTSAA